MSSAWESEYAPESLRKLAESVKVHFGLRAVDIGIKGDESHGYGYHRSRNWINAMGRGRNDYSNQLDLDKLGNGDWLAALDVTLPAHLMKTITDRLMMGVRQQDSRMYAVREFYGTLDGKNVAGYDLAANEWAESDDSHLWHVHISFYRAYAGNDHSGLLDLLRGIEKEVSDMDAVQEFRLNCLFNNWDATRDAWVNAGGDGDIWDQANAQGAGARNGLAQYLNHLNTQIQNIQATQIELRKSQDEDRAILSEILKVAQKGASGGLDTGEVADAVVDDMAKRLAHPQSAG